MADYTATTENAFLIVATNTSPVSLRKIAKRIDDIERGGRVIMTVTKNEAGVLFWTIQEIGRVER